MFHTVLFRMDGCRRNITNISIMKMKDQIVQKKIKTTSIIMQYFHNNNNHSHSSQNNHIYNNNNNNMQPSFFRYRQVQVQQVKCFSLLLQQPSPHPIKSLQFNTIIELQQKAVEAYPDNFMLGYP